MTPHPRVLPLLIALLAGLVAAPAGAQPSREECSARLERARGQYHEQQFAEVERLITTCVDRLLLPATEMDEGFRLLALAFLRENLLADAQATVVKHLAWSFTYEPDEIRDPPLYVALVRVTRAQLTVPPGALVASAAPAGAPATAAPQPAAPSEVPATAATRSTPPADPPDVAETLAGAETTSQTPPATDSGVEPGGTATGTANSPVEPANTAAEPANMGAVPAVTTAEPADAASEAVEPPADPANTAAGHADIASHAVETPADPANTAAESANIAVEPGDSAVEAAETARNPAPAEPETQAAARQGVARPPADARLASSRPTTFIPPPADSRLLRRQVEAMPAPREDDGVGLTEPPAMAEPSSARYAGGLAAVPGTTPAGVGLLGADPSTITEPLDFATVMPEIVGGHAAIRLEYPEFERRAGIEGRVVIGFVVGADGSMSGEEVLRGVGPGLDAAALAALRRLRFVPGRQNGEPVPVRMTLSFDFRVGGRN
jgi:TonB family protein